MKTKKGHVRNTAERSKVQRVSENNSSSSPIAPDVVVVGNSGGLHPTGSIKEVEAIEKVSRVGGSQLEKKYKNLTQRLQVVGSIVAVLAIFLTYWNVRLQLALSTFEKNQRVVEMSVSLAGFWENQLDIETRYRTTRFINKLKSLSPEEQKDFLGALLDSQSMLNPESIKNNKALTDLIDPKFSPDPASSAANPCLEVSKYKSTLVRVLNTMEVIAIVKEHTQDNPEAQRVLESAYSGAIQQRYDELKPFVEAYREKTKAGRDLPAWQPIDDMINGGKNKKSS